MRSGKVIFVASILASSCMAVAGYSLLNENAPLTSSHSQNEDYVHETWVNDFIDIESSIYSTGADEWSRAKAQLVSLHSSLSSDVKRPIDRELTSVARYVYEVSSHIDSQYELVKSPLSFTEMMTAQKLTHDGKTWLMLSALRQSGLSADLEKNGDHYHVVVGTQEGPFEWKSGHTMDVHGTAQTELDEYALWTEFDMQLAKNYIDLDLAVNDEAITTLLAENVDNEVEGAQMMYSKFIKQTQQRDNIVSLK